MSEIKPTEEHLSDPYVLQLIEALAKQGDEIERLQDRVAELRQAVVDMDCSCLPFASQTGEGLCQRCEALRRLGHE